MCGLFGLLRSPLAGHPGRASGVLVALGVLAEERGDDSAGIALLTGHAVAPGRERPAAGTTGERHSDISHDGCRIVKGRGRFTGVWRPDLLPLLDAAPVALGHTRWATQGSPAELVNASPLVVPGTGAGIIATHNGDVEAGLLRERYELPPPAGSTDSETVFQLLARCGGTRDVTAVLRSLVGRAALAWVDRGRPGEVHLARAALSPLAVAVDTEENLYWASNPGWFRRVEQDTGVRFVSVDMLREGGYLKIGTGGVLARAGFTPTARDWDLDGRVWTGFSAADAARDRALLRHLVHEPEHAAAGPRVA
ncbi:class II glutamine amidotransferase [Actinomadura macrotermitis]|uniref:Glutamine--fructose-6-phosphate aminotransferase [isomerizing] n=1 Tax=Actinomadura macrotermitis TaxID=2585200 RepID=A0A7K0BTC2_9ACTN|nr:class II glutamine amidotransferase [Actinomadura macrotermitis]MQY04286.1 hypothetical protein [Actinomadura macrotermitis]